MWNLFLGPLQASSVVIIKVKRKYLKTNWNIIFLGMRITLTNEKFLRTTATGHICASFGMLSCYLRECSFKSHTVLLRCSFCNSVTLLSMVPFTRFLTAKCPSSVLSSWASYFKRNTKEWAKEKMRCRFRNLFLMGTIRWCYDRSNLPENDYFDQAAAKFSAIESIKTLEVNNSFRNKLSEITKNLLLCNAKLNVLDTLLENKFLEHFVDGLGRSRCTVRVFWQFSIKLGRLLFEMLSSKNYVTPISWFAALQGLFCLCGL